MTVSYHSPTELSSALALAAEPGGWVIAGGTDVFPAARQGVHPRHYLDLTRVAGLRGISRTADGWRIGAATTWSDLVRADLPRGFDGLKQAARAVGGVQIQNAGTIAGNLCNASPAADGVPPLLTLEAQVELASAARGTRVLALSAFLKGVRQTALAPDELMTAVHVPALPGGAGAAFEKLGSRRYLVISITMTAALVVCDDAGRIATARVAVGACSATALRLSALEVDLIGQRPEDLTIGPHHLAPLHPITDVRGTADYRLDAVAEQCRRAILRAVRHE